MILRVKRTHPDAILPTYATDGSVGMDLYSVYTKTLYYGTGPNLFSTGIAIELPSGYEAQVRPRSSLSKRGVHCSLGTIDSDYRGEIGVLLWVIGRDAKIERGDRIAQLVIAKCERASLVEVDELSQTDRGCGGFGSTGR